MPASRLLPPDLGEEQYAEAFLEEFGATLDRPSLVRDVLGEALVMGQELFQDRRTGELKANKRGRGRFMKLLADAVLSPDEVWANIEYQHAKGRAVVRRRYVARFLLPGEQLPALAVFEHGETGWGGITVFSSDVEGYLELQRHGVLLYRREE